jgi:Protein of unknown function (DUF3551)
MQKIAVSGAVAMLLLAAAPPVQAQAREYPWCARYDWTTRNCGFVSFQQCLATISGIGGRCEENPRYVPQQRQKKGAR